MTVLQTAISASIVAVYLIAGAVSGDAGAPALARDVSTPRGISGQDPSSAYNDLAAVSAESGTDAWAVGSYTDDATGVARTLILHWDGTAWSQTPSPNASSAANRLWGVATISTTDAWAVGDFDDGTGRSRTLVVHWDGTTWSRITSPSHGSNAYLFGVTALSATNAWAAGYYERRSGSDRTLMLRWDGGTWSRVRSPNPNPRHNFLLGISAASAADVWAVGYTHLNMGDSFAVHWNGTRWSKVSTPNPSGRALLWGISALSVSDAWAVGGTCCNRTLIEHWNGTRWSRSKTPLGGVDDDHFLNATDGVSPRDAWAVGHACKRIHAGPDDTERCRTLTLHWDGERWSRVTSPSPSSSVVAINSGIVNELNGVSAVSATNVWAVGHDDNEATGATEALILHWDGESWSRI